MPRFVTASLATALLLLGASEARAMEGYGEMVNSFCTEQMRVPAMPYAPGDCSLCHAPAPPEPREPAFTQFQAGRDAGADFSAFCMDPAPLNQPPVLEPIGNRAVPNSLGLLIMLTATDPNQDGLRFTVANAPNRARFVDNGDGTAAFTWTPGPNQYNRLHEMTFTVTDDFNPAASASETITIAVGTINEPPVLEPIGPQMAEVGQPLSIRLIASDPVDLLSFEVLNAPAAAVLAQPTPTEALFTWTPGPADVGSHVVTFVVTDSGQPPASASEEVVITVDQVNRPPTLNAIGDQSVNEGETLTVLISAMDLDMDALAFSVAGEPVGALLIDNGDGTAEFTWTPTFDEAGNYMVTFTVTDAGEPALSHSEDVLITVGAVNRPPKLGPVGDRTARAGQPLEFIVAASDPDGDGLSIAAPVLPVGASFLDNGDGTAIFSWTPDAGQLGPHPAAFVATDAGLPPLNAGAETTIMVTPEVPLEIRFKKVKWKEPKRDDDDDDEDDDCDEDEEDDDEDCREDYLGKLKVKGDRAPAGAAIELFDARTDEPLAAFEAKENGKFKFKGYFAQAPCEIRPVVNGMALQPIPVKHAPEDECMP